MWKLTLPLFLALTCFEIGCSAVSEIEVKCLDSKASTITDGGIAADCAFVGLTRTSTMNTWLFSLTNVLQRINASYNHIKTVSVFPDLPRVLSLNLRHNSIRRFDKMAFSGLENLQELDLSYNLITGESLNNVLSGKVSAEKTEPLPIRTLLLSNNNITSLQPDLFTHVEFLRELHLDYNPLIVDQNFSESLRKLPELKLLNLAGANLKYLPKDAFSGLSLTTLYLSDNGFTHVPNLFVLGNSLENLVINGNPIQEFNESSFHGLHSLQQIVATRMPQLTIIKSGTFLDLPMINVIFCSYNPKLSEIEEKAFWDFKARRRSPIRKVYLNNNALKRLKKHVLPWMQMNLVMLDGNRWECDCRIHWLATYLRNRNTTIDKITELKCWEPTWLNGTQLLFWVIDTKNRHENYPCLEEKEEERKEIEQLRNAITTQPPILAPSTILPVLKGPPPFVKEVEEEEWKFEQFHLIWIAAAVAVIILIALLLLGFKKYRNYRPIYNVEKMSSPAHNEMKYMNGNIAEKTQLVPS